MIDQKMKSEIAQLEEELEDLKSMTGDRILNTSKEIQEVEERLFELRKQAYCNLSAWDRVSMAREANRPTALDYIDLIFEEFTELRGDRLYGDDPSTVCGIAMLENCAYTIIAQQKGRNTKENIERNFGMPNPESYRKADRLMKQAEKFERPIITFIDTKGAYPGIGAEERGQGEAIARSMMQMATLRVPIICIVIGEGSSGGALAISLGDKILMLENSIYSILSPEGYASILWKDGTRVKEAAERMKLTAKDLYELKVIDEVLPEPIGGADKDIGQMADTIKTAIIKHSKELKKQEITELVENRYQKFRNIGEYQKDSCLSSKIIN